jgi:hypothetical protein
VRAVGEESGPLDIILVRVDSKFKTFFCAVLKIFRKISSLCSLTSSSLPSPCSLLRLPPSSLSPPLLPLPSLPPPLAPSSLSHPPAPSSLPCSLTSSSLPSPCLLSLIHDKPPRPLPRACSAGKPPTTQSWYFLMGYPHAP